MEDFRKVIGMEKSKIRLSHCDDCGHTESRIVPAKDNDVEGMKSCERKLTSKEKIEKGFERTSKDILCGSSNITSRLEQVNIEIVETKDGLQHIIR